MATSKEVAQSFANGTALKSGNCETNGVEYRLFGNLIAWRNQDGTHGGSFCGRRTPTTSKHLATVARALGTGTPVKASANTFLF
jgi:hypothetical protein